MMPPQLSGKPGPSHEVDVEIEEVSNSPIFEVACERCSHLEANFQMASMKLALLARQSVINEQLEKEVKQKTEQLAEFTTYVEKLHEQLHNLRTQVRNADLERDKAKERERDIEKQMTMMEGASAALRAKAEQAENYKNKYNKTVQICDQVQNKRIAMADQMKAIVSVCNEFKLKTEKLNIEVEKLKDEKVISMNKIRFYKKHIPSMVKVIDDLVPLAGNMNHHMRKRIENLTQQELRSQLIDGQVMDDHQQGGESDEDPSEDLQSIISLAGKAPVSIKKSPGKSRKAVESASRETSPEPSAPAPKLITPRKRFGGGRGRRRAVEQHNIEMAEQAHAMLQSKMARSEEQPMSEIAGGHNTIHGKKGPTIREQQMRMMSVAEKVSMMRLANEGKPKTPCSLKQTISMDLALSESDVETTNSPQKNRRDISGLHDDLRLTPSPIHLSPASSVENLNTIEETDRYQTIQISASLPHLENVEKTLEESNPTQPIVMTSAASMPHLDAEEIQVTEEELFDKEQLQMEETVVQKIKSPKKVKFVILDNETEDVPEGDPIQPIILKQAQKKVIEEKQISSSKLLESIKTPMIQNLIKVAEKEPLEKKDQLSFETEKPMIKCPDKVEENNRKKEMVTEKEKSSEKITVVTPTLSKITEDQAEKKKSIEESNDLSPVAITTPTKKALKAMSTVSNELNSPVKKIPEWAEVSSRFEPSTSKKDTSLHLERKETEVDSSKMGSYGSDHICLLPTKAMETEQLSVQTTKETSEVEPQPKPKPKPIRNTAPVSLQNEETVQLRKSAPTRPSAPKKLAKELVIIEPPVAKTVTVRPIVSKAQKLIESPTKEQIVEKQPTSQSTILSHSSTKNRNAQIEKASKSIAKRLREANTTSKPVAPKKETPVKTKQPAEATKNIEPIELPAKTVNETAVLAKAPQKANDIEAVVPITRTASTRQLKRNVAEQAVNPKKFCPAIHSAEVTFKKALDLKCSIDNLPKKISPSELDEIKTIPEEKVTEIMMEYVIRMNNVDMWALVMKNYRNGMTNVVNNSHEENLLQVSYTYCMEGVDIFTPFIRDLRNILFSQEELDKLRVYKIVRLICMALIAREQTVKTDSITKEIQIIVKFLAMNRPTTLTRSLVYIVNRMPFNCINFLVKTEWQDVLRIAAIYSQHEDLAVLRVYYNSKDTGINLLLPSDDQIMKWINEYILNISAISQTVSFKNDKLILSDALLRLLKLREICLVSSQRLPLAINEVEELINKIKNILEFYQTEEPDAIIGSFFTTASTIIDPEPNVVKELCVAIFAVTSLVNSVVSNASSDKIRRYMLSFSNIVTKAYEIHEKLSNKLDSAPEQRRILYNTVNDLLIFSQNLTQYRILS